MELFIVSKLIRACIYHCHYRALHPLVYIVPIFNLFLSIICIISNLCSLSDIHLFVRFDQNWSSNEFSRKNDLKLFLQNHWDVHWLHVLPNVGVEIENTFSPTFNLKFLCFISNCNLTDSYQGHSVPRIQINHQTISKSGC